MKLLFNFRLNQNLKSIRKNYNKFTIFFTFIFILPMLISAWGENSDENKYLSLPLYYKDIPDITEEEISAIENLKSKNESFTYGSLLGTELFLNDDGSYGGFAYEFGNTLTALFGIPFEILPFKNWDELKNQHDSAELDFIGSLTPTAERSNIYLMSKPITERNLRIFTLKNSKEIIKEKDIENFKIGFLEETITAASIKKVYPIDFEIIELENYESAANKLMSGEINAFVEEEDADTFFLDYAEIESKKFFPMVYTPISMSSANQEFASVISVINKYLNSGGADKLVEMHDESSKEYAIHKFKRMLTEEEHEFLENAKSNPVKLIIEHDNYPISFYNTSTKTYQGIAVEILEKISEISGIKFEIVSNEKMKWTEMLNMLEKGEASMITQLLYVDERKDSFIWSDSPYNSSNYAILSRRDYPDTSNLQIFRTTVGVLNNSGHGYIFNEWFPDHTKIKKYDSQNEAVEALTKGEINLFMASELIQLSQTNYYENSGLKINILLSTPMDSYFGFNKNEKVLNSIISDLMLDIDIYSIERSWMSRNFDYQKNAATERMNYFMIFCIVLSAVLVLTIFLVIKNERMSENLANIVAKRTFELERQTATLTSIYESIPDIVYTMDTNLIYTSCNTSFEKFVGVSKSDIIGKEVHEVLRTKLWADYFKKSNQEVILSAEPVIVEEEAFYPDGTPATFETIKTPLIQNGELIGMLGIARNITERKYTDERTKLMLNSNPLACNLVDKDFNVIDSNEEAAKLFGFKDKQEYLDRFWEIFPEYQPDGQLSSEKAHMMVRKAFEEGRVTFEWMHRKPDDGTPIPSELTLVRTRYGRIDVITGYIRDLRSHKKMLAQIQHKDNMLQTVNNAASILIQSETEDFENDLWRCMGMMAEAVKVDRVYIWKNYTENGQLCCTQIYEWSEKVESQQSTNLANGAMYSEIVPGWEEILSAGKCINGIVRNLSPLEQESLSPQGIISILITPVFIRDSFWGFVGFDDCKHERVFSEDEVRSLRSGSIMIASALLRNEMTMDIQNAVETAQEASRAKGNFLSNMSHEIRTPLNAIIGMTTIGKSSPIIGKKDYSFDKISEASTHLLGIINDILDMSKIEANKFELSYFPFSFEEMIRKVVSVVNLRMYEKNQNFDVYIDSSIPNALIGDNQRLTQVITNLLSNAVKFTPEGGNMSLDAQMLKEENGICTILINVTDTGIGVDPSRQPFIFDSFEQSDNNIARKYGGTGLGLSISKRIVELMGGSIWVNSEQGKGSTFSFTVEIKRDASEKSPIIHIGAKGIKTLIIDDNLEFREYFKRITLKLGIDCDVAASGEEVLELIKNGNEYDLLFVDCDLSDMSINEFSERAREKSKHELIIIIISTFDWSGFRDDEIKMGVDKIISKPLLLSTVADCINSFFGNRGTVNKIHNNEDSVSFHGKRLLLAEDIEINREIVISLLEETGIEIECAENGIEALRMFKEAPKRYDLIFMDIQMPEMDGLEATQQIRSLEFDEAKKIPIIAMTANVFQEDIDRCKLAGMNDHVGKPLNIDDVLNKIEIYL